MILQGGKRDSAMMARVLAGDPRIEGGGVGCDDINFDDFDAKIVAEVLEQSAIFPLAGRSWGIDNGNDANTVVALWQAYCGAV